ncbi:MAG: hypothetical protein AB1758_10735, partial [Candidatus Eremiobacterota bacterium]
KETTTMFKRILTFALLLQLFSAGLAFAQTTYTPLNGVACSRCSGTGKCWTCGGTGVGASASCSMCSGSGKCYYCSGLGTAIQKLRANS